MNLQPCEIWLDPRTKALLHEVTARHEGSKQENYSRVILAALMALERNDNSIMSDESPQSPRSRHGETRCQAQTMSGTRCKISRNLSIVREDHGHEVLACPQHVKRFRMHRSDEQTVNGHLDISSPPIATSQEAV